MKKHLILYSLIFLISNLGLAQLPLLKIGAEKGVASINGEVEPATGFGLGFFLEKPITSMFSVRLYGAMGSMRGQDLKPSQNWVNHPSWNGTIDPLANYQGANTNFIFANYQTTYLEASIQGKLTFTQFSFWNNQSNFDAFLLGGVGLMQFETKIDALGNDQAIYDFIGIPVNPATDIEALAVLNLVQDGNYESNTEAGQKNTPLYQIGAGIEWRVHRSINLALSYRFSWTNTDLLDSYQWGINNTINGQNDTQHYTSIGLSYVFTKKKPAEPMPIQINLPTKPDTIVNQPVANLPIIDVPKDSIILPEPNEVKIVELNIKDSVVVRRAFDNLEFETDKAIIRSVSFVPLSELADLLVDHPNWKLKISGHTDNVGDPDFNRDLSRRRAEAVRDYLNNQGVALNRLLVEYFGETKPLATNNTRAGRQKNRRVELLIIE